MIETEEQRKEAHAFYKEALEILNESGARYMLGGAFAMFHYTGIYRDTKDLDIFVRVRDCGRVLTVLRDAGATLHRYGDPVVKYHAKYIVSDTCALVASANWTHKCLERTCDFALVTTDPGVVRALAAVFAVDCAEEALASDVMHERLIIGPENARDRLTALLASARRSIDIVDPKLTDPATREQLAERARAGVRVTCHDADRVGPLAAHGKLIVVDGRAAVVGSLSLSPIHLAFRRELSLLTTDPDVMASLNGFLGTLPDRGDGAASEATPRAR